MADRPKLALIGALAMFAGAEAQQDFSQVQIEPIEVADGIYMLKGRGGNIGLSVGEDVVHTGDLFFNGRFPYIDLGSGGSVVGYADAVRALERQIPSDARIIPGHGDLATHDDLKRFTRMLEESTALVRAGIETGKSLEQIQDGGVPGEWTGWGQGFVDDDRWLSIVYESLR